MAIAGTGIFLWSMAELACMGKGTLSFLIPTRRLVREGPYSRSRNPMYAGVTIILLGEALFFLSLPLLIYAAAAWSIFHLLIIPMEERRLVRDFGYAFEYYSQAVRRWI